MNFTGDTLTISSVFWAGAWTVFVQAVQETRSRQQRWALAYAAAGIALLAMGFGWPSIVTMIHNPPTVSLQIIFGLGQVCTGLAFAFWFRPKDAAPFSNTFMALFGQGVCVPPFLVLIIAPYFHTAAFELLREQQVSFALAGLAGTLATIEFATRTRRARFRLRARQLQPGHLALHPSTS